jgi:adenine-specific DNA-methyltransferase
MSVRKTRGEVFTPMDLINEMLDKLPNEVWDDPTLKWLEPSAGNGRFVKAVYDRLMLTIKDEKHILENMLYMVELDADNCETIRNTYDTKYKLNLFEGNYTEYTTDIQFDIIYGNPPYQNTDGDGKRRALLNNLWSVFIYRSFNNLLKDNGYLLFITPYSWMTPSFKHKDIFYNNYIIYLNIKECEKHFKGVGSSFSYYLIKKTSNKKNTKVICLYNKNIYECDDMYINNDINFLPILLSKDSLSIIDKFYNNKLKKISFESSSELHHWKKKELIGECNKTIFKYPILHTSSYNNICSKIKHSLAGKNKILLNTSGYLEPIYDAGKYGFTEAQLYILTNNKNYVDVLNSKLYKFICKICKWSGFNSLSIFKNLPYIEKFNNDKELYDYFKLTRKEINLIEENTKEFDKIFLIN